MPAVALAAAVTISASTQSPLAQANAALQAGEADKALALLSSLPQSDASQAETYNLECRVRYTLEQWDEAARQCEEAVRLDGQNSDYHLWLGRALGKKAERASFLKAYSLAKRVRGEFEESVDLNPSNAEALTSLGDYYVQAPGIGAAELIRRKVSPRSWTKWMQRAPTNCVAALQKAARIMARPSASLSRQLLPARIWLYSGRHWLIFTAAANAGRRWNQHCAVADRGSARQARRRCAL